MLKIVHKNINKRFLEDYVAPSQESTQSNKNVSSGEWNITNYQYDGSNYNWDNYQTAPFEQQVDSYLAICALADVSTSMMPSLGQINTGTVQNVANPGRPQCIGNSCDTIGNTVNRMAASLNAAYKAEVEAGTLFPGQGADPNADYASYLKDLAAEHTEEIFQSINSFSPSDDTKDEFGSGVDSSLFETPEQLAEAYESISGKDPSEWTNEDKYIIAAYHDDLAARVATEKAKADENGIYATDAMAYDLVYGEYEKLASELKSLEKDMKSEGLMDKTGWDKFTDGAKRVVATGVEGYATIYAGIAKVLEYGYDAKTQLESWGKTAVDFARSGAALILGDEEEAAEIAATSKERIARDKELIALPLTETIYHAIFGGTNVGKAIDSESAMKHDSELAGKVMDTTTDVTKGALATAMMVSGAGIPLTALGGFTLGIGETAEDRYNMDNKDDAFIKNDALAIVAGATGKAAEFTGEGVMGSNVVGIGKAVKTVASAPKAVVEIVKKTGSVIAEHPITWNDVINKKVLSSIGNSIYKGAANNFASLAMETAAPFGELSTATNTELEGRDIKYEIGEAYLKAAGHFVANSVMNVAEGVVLNTANSYASRAFGEAITDYLDSGRVYTDVSEKLGVDEATLRQHDFSVSVKNASTDDYLAKHPRVLGYSNSPNKSVVLSSDHFVGEGSLAKSYDELYDTAVHEALHQMSTKSDGYSTGLGYDGINEATTEYLAQKVTGVQGSGYATLVPEMERLVDSGVLSDQTLIDGYFNPTPRDGIKAVEREIANNIVGVTNNKYDAANAYGLTDAFQYAFESLDDSKQHKQDVKNLKGAVDDVIGLFTGTK